MISPPGDTPRAHGSRDIAGVRIRHVQRAVEAAVGVAPVDPVMAFGGLAVAFLALFGPTGAKPSETR